MAIIYNIFKFRGVANTDQLNNNNFKKLKIYWPSIEKAACIPCNCSASV